ncbi:MAG: hypothetical protein LM586_04015 [Desulfurococcales archaeon]|nr:hypothetical protein [Desulfurococcales archaeon]
MRLLREFSGKIYFLLSMDRVEEALLEAEALSRRLELKEFYREPGIIVYEGHIEKIISLGDIKPILIKEIGLILYVLDQVKNEKELYEFIRSVEKVLCVTREIEIKTLGYKYLHPDPFEIKRSLRLCSEENILKKTTILIGSKVFIGRSIYVRDLFILEKIKGSSATMKHIDIKFMNNIVIFDRSSLTDLIIYDPFAGNGYLLKDLCKNDIKMLLLSDIDPLKVERSKKIYSETGCDYSEHIVADAFRTPLRDCVIDVILSDLPYGRRSRIIHFSSEKEIMKELFEEFKRISYERSIIMIAISIDQWRDLVRKHKIFHDNVFQIRGVASQYLHKILQRVYVYIKATNHICKNLFHKDLDEN